MVRAVLSAARCVPGVLRNLSRTSGRPLAAFPSRYICSTCNGNRKEKLFLEDRSTKSPTGFMYAQYMSTMAAKDHIFRQLFDDKSWTYTYILADPKSKEAVIIDPVIEQVDRDVKTVQELGLNLIYAVNTHVHADHVTGTGEIKKRIPGCKSVIAEPDAVADIHIKHGDKIKFGPFELDCRSTPGHTDGCMTYVWHQKALAFTGDALLIRGCGRTDFQAGDPERLYESVHGQILSLPDSTSLYPAHDYKGQTVTSVDEEKKYNPRLTKTKEEFAKIMNELGLPYPKQIDKAVPANMKCGLYDVESS